MIENDESISLVIEKLKPEDAGKYTCEIKNSQGTASSSSNVTITGIYLLFKFIFVFPKLRLLL